MTGNLAQQRDALIDRLYDAALFGEPWDAWLGQVVASAGAHAGLLILQNTETLEIAHTVQVGFDPGQRERYEREFRLHDVWVQEMRRLPRDAFYPTEAVVSHRDFTRTLIYNEFCKGQDIDHAAAAFLSIEGPWAVRFCLQRSRAQGAFREDELEPLQGLVPHLRRCVSLAESVGLLHAGLDALLERYDAPCLLVTPSLQVVAQNRAAQDLVAELPCLAVRRGRLAVRQAELARRIEALVHGCHDPRAAADDPPLVRMPRRDRAPMILSAIPVPTGSPFLAFGKPVILLFRDAERTPAASAQALAKAYALTPAEARVAGLIGAGLPIKRAAAELSVSVNAIKFHLRAIYAKTGVHRQSELVARILALSAR